MQLAIQGWPRYPGFVVILSAKRRKAVQDQSNESVLQKRYDSFPAPTHPPRTEEEELMALPVQLWTAAWTAETDVSSQ